MGAIAPTTSTITKPLDFVNVNWILFSDMTRKRRFFYAPYAPRLVSDSDEGDDIEDDLEDFGKL